MTFELTGTVGEHGMATQLDLNSNHVWMRDLTVDEVRADDEALERKLAEWLDEAQAPVFGGEAKEAYLVIKITPAA
jgi:hypothetical protein